MFLPVKSPPLPWQLYVKLPRNQGLNVMKVKENYLREQYEFENYISYINWLNMQPKGPVIGGTPVSASGIFGSGYWDDNGVWIDTENWID